MSAPDQTVLHAIARQPDNDPWVRLPHLRAATRLPDSDLMPALDRLVASGAVLHEWRVGVRGGAYRAAQKYTRTVMNKLSRQSV